MTLQRKYASLLVIIALLLCWPNADTQAQSFNQRHNTIDYMYQGNSVDSKERQVIFYFFPFKGSLIDLRAYKKMEGAHGLPDQVAIDLPDMGGFSDTTIGIAHLEFWHRNDTVYIPVITLVGNMNSPYPTFIFDKDLNRDYRLEEPLTFTARRKFYNIQLKDGDGNSYGFSLENFKMREAKNAIEEMKRKQRKVIQTLPPRTHQLTVDMNVNIGFGKIQYEYRTAGTGLPVSYLENLSATGLMASVNYSWKQKLNLEARFGFDNIFYWTSTKTVQVTPELLLEKINRDRKPSTRLSGEFNLGYNMRLGSDIIIRPYLGYALYTLSGDNLYQPEVSQRETYTLTKKNFAVIGVRPHVQLNPRNMAYLDIGFRVGKFDADGFFEAENASSVLENPFREFRLGLGMNYRFL